MTRRLAKEEGIFVGWSAGSAVYGALEYAREHLKDDDMMVIILHDHGTRYLGKVFNDDWMQDHGFLDSYEFATAKDIISGRSGQDKLLTIDHKMAVGNAIDILSKAGIDQLPVTNNDSFVGSLASSRLLHQLINDPSIKEEPVEKVMDKPMPFVAIDETLNVISSMLDQENKAVLVRGEDLSVHIITQHDLLLAITS